MQRAKIINMQQGNAADLVLQRCLPEQQRQDNVIGKRCAVEENEKVRKQKAKPNEQRGPKGDP